MKILLFILSFIIISCEESDTFEEEKASYSKTVVLENNKTYNDCHRGCYYYFNILTTIKEVNQNALNLSLTNINDFDKECKKFCDTTPELKKDFNPQIRKEIKSFEDKVEESSQQPEEKVKTKKSKSMELTPFEEL